MSFNFSALPKLLCCPCNLWQADTLGHLLIKDKKKIKNSIHWSSAPKKTTSHGNEMLLQDTTHLIQRPCYQWGSPCQDPAGNWTTQRPDDRKQKQNAAVWSCFLFIRAGQNHLARHSERGKKTRKTEEEVGRQHQEMDRLWVRRVPKASREQGKVEQTSCEILCGVPTTLMVKG